MLLQPRFCLIDDRKLSISENVQIVGDIGNDTASLLKNRLQGCGIASVVCSSVEIIMNIPESYIEKCRELSNRDSFVIEADAVMKIYSNSISGVFFAASLIESYGDDLKVMTAYDYPSYDLRAYKIFLPSKNDVENITELLDLITDCRCNTLMLELGGALEYKRHPEINRTWEEYCLDVGEYSGKGFKISNGEFFPWPKNVIHVDNGGGSFITQEQARFIKSECDKRGIEIICEIPSLSHCDYLVKTYPEINERAEDVDYPDSYCPNNPKTYEILFDVIDEAVEIFKPRYVNIGHDELFSIGICDKCKGKDPVELYVKDVEKIQGYLKSKGIETMMWADMLCNSRPRHGGAGRSVPGDPQYVPPLYEIRDRLPKDVIMLNWWAIHEPTLSSEIEERGFRMLLGNLSAYTVKEWSQFKCKNLFGGFQYNWGSLKPEYMQRNRQYFALLFNASVLWSGIGEDEKEKTADEVLREAYERNKRCGKNKGFEVLVTTDYYTEARYFYDGDFIIDSEFILGNLVATLKDGTTRKFLLKYGQNIGNCDVTGETWDTDKLVFAMGSLPLVIDGKCWYKCFWDADFEIDAIEKIEFEKILDNSFNIEYKIVEENFQK